MSKPYRITEKQSKPNPIRLDPNKQRLDLYWPCDLVEAIRIHCVRKRTKPSAYIQTLVRADLETQGHIPAQAPVAAAGGNA